MHRVPQIPPSRLIRINSRFKEFGGTNSKFQYSFGQNRLVDSVYQIALVTASLPKTYTNIYEPINELSWTLAGTVQTLTIPPGQYTAVSLAAQINTHPNLTVTYDEATSRFQILCSPAIKILASSSIAAYIGLTGDIQSAGVTFPLQAPPNLSGCANVYIQSKFLASVNCMDNPNSVSEYIPVMTAIDCSSVPFGFNISHSVSTIDSSRISYGGRASLRVVDIEITDEFGNHSICPRMRTWILYFVYTIPTNKIKTIYKD